MSAWSNFYNGILLPGAGGLYRGREPFPAPPPAVAKQQPAVMAIQQAAPSPPPLPSAAMALAPTAAPMASRPISNTSAQMRGPNLLDLLSGGGKPSTLGMLLAGLNRRPSSPFADALSSGGGSSSRSPGSYFSVATGGNSSEGGIEGNGGITGYY